MAIAALTIDLNARVAKFEDDMARVRKSLGGLEKTTGTLKAGFAGLFAGVGVAGLAAFAKNGIDAADALKDMSDKLGVSVKDLASFKLAAEQSGTSLDDVGKGIARLTRSIGQAEGGNKELGKALTALGISARDPKEAFFQLADATEKIQDPAKRAALLAQVLGKSYQDMIPFLSQGSGELRKLAQESESFAQTMSRLAPDADKFNDELARLKQEAATAAGGILTHLVPALSKLFESYQNLNRLGKAGANFDDIFFGNVSGDISRTIKAANDDIKSLEGRIAFSKKLGVFGDSAPLEKELARVKAIRNEARKISFEGAMKIADDQYKKTPKGVPGSIDLPTGKTATGSAKATDPLASLLSQTDTAKFAEYTKLQDLLNSRFERGAITGKQYAEALTLLRQGYFTEELKAFSDQLEYNAETERLTAEHLKGTTAALNEQKNAWSEAGAALKNDMMTPLEQFDDRLEYINELFRRGAIDADTFHRATADAFENIGKEAKDAADKTKDPFEDAFKQMGSALSDFVATGKLDFKSLVKDMLAGLAKIQFQKALDGLAGNADSGGVMGLIGTFAKAIKANAKGNVFNSAGLSAYSGSIISSPTVFPFAKGIGLMGEAGPEAIMPLKRGKDGKLGVAASGGGSAVVNISIDASGTKTQGDEGKAGQLARELEGAVMGVIIKQQRNGGLLAQG